jgi:hypothetical protein
MRQVDGAAALHILNPLCGAESLYNYGFWLDDLLSI